MMHRFLFNLRPLPFLSPEDGGGQGGAAPEGTQTSQAPRAPQAPAPQETPRTLDDVLADKAMQAEFEPFST